jgi:hypothetical protein
LEGIKLSKISQIQEDKYHISLICVNLKKNNQKVEEGLLEKGKEREGEGERKEGG